MQFLKQDDLAKLILRLALGLMILLHGFSKLAHPESLSWISGMVVDHGLPHWVTYGVLVGEVLAPLLIIIGWWTRLGAFLIVGNMFFVFWLVHMKQLFMLTEHGGWAVELQGFYLFTALAVLFLGSGKHAVKPD